MGRVGGAAVTVTHNLNLNLKRHWIRTELHQSAAALFSALVHGSHSATGRGIWDVTVSISLLRFIQFFFHKQ